MNDHYGRGERVDSASQPLRDATQEPWYGTRVHWGEKGMFDFTTGPLGPSGSKGPLL